MPLRRSKRAAAAKAKKAISALVKPRKSTKPQRRKSTKSRRGSQRGRRGRMLAYNAVPSDKVVMLATNIKNTPKPYLHWLGKDKTLHNENVMKTIAQLISGGGAPGFAEGFAKLPEVNPQTVAPLLAPLWNQATAPAPAPVSTLPPVTPGPGTVTKALAWFTINMRNNPAILNEVMDAVGASDSAAFQSLVRTSGNNPAAAGNTHLINLSNIMHANGGTSYPYDANTKPMILNVAQNVWGQGGGDRQTDVQDAIQLAKHEFQEKDLAGMTNTDIPAAIQRKRDAVDRAATSPNVLTEAVWAEAGKMPRSQRIAHLSTVLRKAADRMAPING